MGVDVPESRILRSGDSHASKKKIRGGRYGKKKLIVVKLYGNYMESYPQTKHSNDKIRIVTRCGAVLTKKKLQQENY